jgi:bacillithiol system protein YtxJ
MNWQKLNTIEQVEQIKAESYTQPVLIFKHSIRCPISAAALRRFEQAYQPNEVSTLKSYYLDLITFRPVSNAIETQFKVMHESPQVLLIKNGQCTYHASHINISYEKVKLQVPSAVL